MTPLPQASDYVNAIDNRVHRFKNQRIRYSQPVFRDNNKKNTEIKYSSGNYAIVFELVNGSNTYAVRCFTKIVDGQKERYAAISAHIQQYKQHLPMLVDFEFLNQEVRAGDTSARYPVVLMDYIKHTPFLDFIRTIPENEKEKRLGDLAQQWQDILKQLEGVKIAHGDLQHGNIIVDTQNKLWLVDYDGMYVPQLQGKPPAEVGLSNYQHHERKYGYFEANTDAFSGLLIYTSLRAMQADPKLWKMYPGDEYLLFKVEDFVDPDHSLLWPQLAQSADPDVIKLAARLEECWHQPITSLPHLSKVLVDLPGYTSKPLPGRTSVSPRTSPSKTSASTPTVPIKSRSQPVVGSKTIRLGSRRRRGRTLLFGGLGILIASTVLLCTFRFGSVISPSSSSASVVASIVPDNANRSLTDTAFPPTVEASSTKITTPIPSSASPPASAIQPAIVLPDLGRFGTLTVIAKQPQSDASETFKLCGIVFSASSFSGRPQLRCETDLPTGTRDLAWSNDGSQLLFSVPPLHGGVSQLQIFLMMPADGAVPQALTEPIENARRPRWRPNTPGEFAFEAENQSGVFEIQTMQLDRSNRRTLVRTTAASIWPAWSSDGQALLFSSDAQDGYHVYRAEAAEIPSEGITSISGVAAISTQDSSTTCVNSVVTSTNDMAYLCDTKNQSYLIAGTQRFDIPLTIHPHGYLTWLPNNSGYVFECGVDSTGRDRSRLCVADIQRNSVIALDLDETQDYYAPAFRPMTQTK